MPEESRNHVSEYCESHHTCCRSSIGKRESIVRPAVLNKSRKQIRRIQLRASFVDCSLSRAREHARHTHTHVHTYAAGGWIHLFGCRRSPAEAVGASSLYYVIRAAAASQSGSAFPRVTWLSLAPASDTILDVCARARAHAHVLRIVSRARERGHKMATPLQGSNDQWRVLLLTKYGCSGFCSRLIRARLFRAGARDMPRCVCQSGRLQINVIRAPNYASPFATRLIFRAKLDGCISCKLHLPFPTV